MVEVPPEVEQVSEEYSQLAEPAAWGIFAFVVAYLVGQLVVRPAIMRVIRRRNQRNPTLVDAVGRYTRLAILVLAAIIGLAFSGYGDLLSGSALVIAAATLALGVAGQEVIGDLVSGLFLVVDPDFNVGDWIEWEEGAGVVETIRFRVTRVRTADNQVIVVPNTTLATSAVTHPYNRNRIRIGAEFGISYDDSIDAAATALREEVEELEGVLETPRPQVVVEDLGDSAVHLRVFFWLEDPTRKNVIRTRSTYIRRVKERLEAAGIGVSPPSEHDLSGALHIDGDRDPGPDPGSEP
ncbi:mechanosensitive ion channel [Natronomonas salina]|uniref:mechanosensitive ion channel family protein n=1 Tax=Natronomonas salina TaxID=1710540 RepID=UPI0015B63972|nr:mechanosensitive ion channel domain-containing protein [Natronomonas salina]QLD89229.1 mechanosensitive ion channel [Natronomonas salina]